MRILAIETSCDETAAAVLEGTGERLAVVASRVRSQIETHAVYGGVIPEVAAREHAELMMPLLHGLVPPDGAGIDAVAVTYGPGLAPALRVGVATAVGLAIGWQKPLVGVCHLEGHIYAAWLPKAGDDAADRPLPQFPVLALVVSGGHTELVLMKDHGEFERLGETHDDAAGEAFDKVASMLGLAYPGGPKVAALAEGGDVKAFAFPRALLKDKTDDFSFSGLKTSVLYTLREHEALIEEERFRSDIAASFQEAVVDVLVQKTMRAAARLAPKSIVLAGGVAANAALRGRLQEVCDAAAIPLFLPQFAYTLDNAAMIGAAGYFRFLRGDVADPLSIKANPSLDIV